MAQLKARILFKHLGKFVPWIVSAIGLPTVATFVWTIYKHPETVSSSAWHTSLWVSSVAVGCLLVWYAVEWYHQRRLVDLGREISERYADVSELDMVHAFCCTFYTRDDHVINRDSLRDFMAVNHRTVKLFYRGDQPVGLYIIFSIKSDAVRRILDGSITTAQQLNRAYAVKDRGAPAGLYVTNICGTGTIARGTATMSIIRDILERYNRHRTIRYVFGRNANRDGGEILKNNDFKRINENMPDLQIWKFDLTAKLSERALQANAPDEQWGLPKIRARRAQAKKRDLSIPPPAPGSAQEAKATPQAPDASPVSRPVPDGQSSACGAVAPSQSAPPPIEADLHQAPGTDVSQFPL